MPEKTRLLTLVHISDLHIAELDPATGDAAISERTRKLISNLTWFDGLLGHHSIALQQLERFWREIVGSDPNTQLIVSGDITRCGSAQELSNASQFLSASLAMPWGTAGLGVRQWLDLTIPGNHDHWSGKPHVFGGPEPSVARSLLNGRFPWIQQVTLGGHRVQFIGIDTDTEVSPRSRSRLLAIGKFQSQLAEAKTELLKHPDYSVRVLVMHHSWHKKDGVLRIAKASRGALAQFLDEEDVRIVLSGHVHRPAVKGFQPVAAGHTVYECRCGTTTQIDKMSYDAKSLLGAFPARPDWPSNSLLVHRLFELPGGRLQWEVETFVRARRKFTKVSSTHYIPL